MSIGAEGLGRSHHCQENISCLGHYKSNLWSVRPKKQMINGSWDLGILSTFPSLDKKGHLSWKDNFLVEQTVLKLDYEDLEAGISAASRTWEAPS